MNALHLRVPAGIFAALVCLLISATTVGAAWSSSTVDDSWLLTRPSLAVDSVDHTGIAYQRSGQGPGIYFATNASSSWVSTSISSGADYEPSLRFDAGDHAQVAFARRAGTTGIYLATNSTGSWAAPALIAADLDPSAPTLA